MPAQNGITLVVVDDHPLFRQGVLEVFSREDDFQVIGQASNGEDALRILRILRPNLALVDVNLPGMNGHQVVRTALAERIPTYFILFSGYDLDDQAVHAFRSGARAYCSKDLKPEAILEVCRNVAHGAYVVGQIVYSTEGIQEWLAEAQAVDLRPAEDPSETMHPLSSREMEILAQLARGLNNREIAARVEVSEQTVKNHISMILRKLGVEDRTQAVVKALRLGWVRNGDPET